jgi:hypothetical protein
MFVNQQVLGLQVPVKDAVGVAEGDAEQHLIQIRLRRGPPDGCIATLASVDEHSFLQKPNTTHTLPLRHRLNKPVVHANTRAMVPTFTSIRSRPFFEPQPSMHRFKSWSRYSKTR